MQRDTFAPPKGGAIESLWGLSKTHANVYELDRTSTSRG